ncbi:bifunctional glutamate N-acetyltransferase/amino-acid acetyltransferase ArgJ [Geobacter sp. AOG1]|uniref:bifunctional glutamate N-acetyltransferase/amino-acid acetyltransferase ArgJ n=1 Tax=Geobacter sp. AOG1 TaxID=1566346 RepID=UPI001CC4C435|nr:bifunctional glutamate N-acetyltransferase/amino-acid acetyltransferase ArgJ [Geobacter sp. AOG1]GFE58261.1 arginine biosynthesis bifunctional protein ArgJ [Geobacter sp. AOG1]
MEIKGFKFSAVEAAIKKPGRLDLALIFSEMPATLAAVFTTNKVKAAPVVLGMERAKDGICQAVVVNSGNANACTGTRGMEDARETSRLVAEGLGIPDEAVQVSSTGVIGVPLPMERLRGGVPKLVEGLESGALDDVAQAIMTTDTFPKLEARQGEAGGVGYTIAGIAKGAGMIMPNMATMLAFLVTDAAVEAGWLRTAFRQAVDASFNVITVDGDTSTNDTALLLANGAAGNLPIKEGTPEAARFMQELQDVVLTLARQIVRDGEGATKFVAITVKGASSVGEARQAAMAVANSSLVKTAFFGQDANWGRILAAVGYSGVAIDPDRVALFFDDVLMANNGVFAGGDAETRGSEVLRKKEFTVTVDLRLGEGSATVYTSDLSYDYVKINADYRT